MASILPIPTGRTSDYLARTRLVQQIQSDQTALVRLQTQLSTGRRIFLPSDDPGASLQAITLQRTLERKSQLQVNVSSTSNRLSAAESSLTEVANILNDVRSKTLGVIDSVTTEEERQAIVTVVNEALESLTRFANSQHEDTYLFGGGRALQPPYVGAGNYVEYRGNEDNLQANVEINQLFDTNISGDQVFGGLSEPVRGSVDLNLQASAGTYLSQLNGGAGVSTKGSIEVSVGANSYVVDLSGAHTLGDVARKIEQAVPASAGVTVDVGGSGLVIDAVAQGLAINEVGDGRIAQELGIRQESPLLPPGVIGGDVDPVLRKTSLLSDLLGTKATGRVELGPSDARLTLRATENGDHLNDLTINIIGGAAPGAESAAFAAGAPPELTLTIAEGATTARDIAELINNDAAVPFEAATDYYNATSSTAAGQGVVSIQAPITGVTEHGGGAALDLQDGLRITNGEGEIAIDTSGAQTVEDLLGILNRSQYGLLAEINDAGTGLDVRSRRAGADFTIGENGGSLAAQLGLRSFTAESRIEDFNRGAGVVSDDSYMLTLDHYDGAGNVSTYRINLSDDALGDFSGLDASVTGSLDLRGSYTGVAGDNLQIVFQESAADTTHTSTLAGNTLTVTVGTNGLAPGAAVDLDAIFSSLQGGDFTAAVSYTAGDINGAYTVGTDAGQAVQFQGGGSPLSVAGVNQRIEAATDGLVTAGIKSVGNGFELSIDNSGGQQLAAYGAVAERLGFFDADAGQTEALDAGGTLASADRNTQEVNSTFNTLLRLRDALEANDELGIANAYATLEDDLDRATHGRAELGVRVQSLEVLQLRLEDEEVQLRSTLSEAIDADLAEVISDFTARQFALQASLQTTASLLQLSLLNFI